MLEFPDNYDLNRHVNYVSGRFRVNGGGAIDNTLNVGRGFTATRTGVGVATVKILQPARAWIKFVPSIVDVGPTGAGGQLRVVLSDFAQGADGCWTFTITQTDLNNAGPAAIEWLASDAKNWIQFDCELQLGAA
jgi:hypothetical protein